MTSLAAPPLRMRGKGGAARLSLTNVTCLDESEPDESRLETCHHQLLEASRKRAPRGDQVDGILVDNW